MNKRSQSNISAGIILIGIGVVFLLNTFGVIDHFNWRLFFQYWPIFIILIGLNLILKNTPFWWLTTTLFVVGIIVLFTFNNGFKYSYSYNYDYEYSNPVKREGVNGLYQTDMELKQGIEKLEVDLDFSAGRLWLGSVSDKNILYDISSRYRWNRPQHSFVSRNEGKTGSLKIHQERGVKYFNISGKNNWKLNFTPLIPLFIEINTGAGDFNLNLEELVIEELRINSGAGDLDISTGEYTNFVKINSAAVNLELNIPANKPISIKTSGLISNDNFREQGLIEVEDNIYQSSNFNNKVAQTIIEINAPASNIVVNYYRVD